MRAQEFLSKIGFGTGSQTEGPVSVSVSDTEPEEILNPGQRSDNEGNYKWSPPLQQQLDAVKDAVGPSNDEITVADAEEAQNELSAVKRTIGSLIGALTNVVR
jgi:hypothetical protein